MELPFLDRHIHFLGGRRGWFIRKFLRFYLELKFNISNNFPSPVYLNKKTYYFTKILPSKKSRVIDSGDRWLLRPSLHMLHRFVKKNFTERAENFLLIYEATVNTWSIHYQRLLTFMTAWHSSLAMPHIERVWIWQRHLCGISVATSQVWAENIPILITRDTSRLWCKRPRADSSGD